MNIENFVKKDYLTAEPFSGINVLKKELLKNKAIVVKEKENYIGTLTAYDILHRPHNLVIDCISEKKQITTNNTVCETLQIMKEESTEVSPVYKNNNFIGLVYKSDLIDYLTDYTKDLNQKINSKETELKHITNNIEKIILEKTNELQKQNTTKDKFFSIVAHDLRSPFNTIIGFSNLLIKNSKEYSSDKNEQIATRINKVSRQTHELLENLLEWSRIQRNQIVFNPQNVNLKELIEHKMLKMSSLAKNKNIKLITNLKKSVNIYADLNMLNLVLRNLISNSIKFTKERGSISINVDESEEFTQISVSDTGIGMSQEQIKKLFDINTQMSTIGTKQEKGSGLGLILCKEFIKKQGGEIFVKSKEGQGSCFSFTIPRKINNILTQTA